jgi:hypothetical protein
MRDLKKNIVTDCNTFAIDNEEMQTEEAASKTLTVVSTAHALASH